MTGEGAAGDRGEHSPEVSVVIPCFNSAATLPETLQSVRAQTLQSFEVVLVDDGSAQETRGLIERVLEAWGDARLRVVWQANAGTAAARNRGIAAARAPYILPLDADDLIAPTMLQACVGVLDQTPEVDVVYTDREDFGEVTAVRPAGRFALQRLKYFNQLGYCSLYRRSLWRAIGGYRTNVSGFDDWDFWLAAALRGCKARHVPEALFRHRRRADSLLWRLLPHFERLHAQIMLNNAGAYSAAELTAARRCLDGGEPASVLRSARFVFLSRYFADYPGAARRLPGCFPAGHGVETV